MRHFVLNSNRRLDHVPTRRAAYSRCCLSVLPGREGFASSEIARFRHHRKGGFQPLRNNDEPLSLWKYLLIVFTIAVAAVYSLPNLFGETPAVQVSTNRQAIIINEQTQSKVDAALKTRAFRPTGCLLWIIH
ncbi:preprotein translocase subunit SecD [Neisseria gonorrhoeae]|uniref:Preprotein translocase subunit SecD n=1 Tax=Neisseria gonorrhoeae TaxID=485 RepID=A0A378W0G2_NEIGO|nr:preprotein translocase subunit SecD [Neisseria gonorrhoeae]